MNVSADFYAAVELLETESGGRKGPTPETYFGCVLLLKGVPVDCRLLLEDGGPIAPGEKRMVGVKLLRPDIDMMGFAVGAVFEVWEGRVIGSGTVTSLQAGHGNES